MKRLAVIPLALAVLSTAHAQTLWQGDDDRPARRQQETEQQRKDSIIPPLSPNTILGRVQWVDTEKKIAILVLDRLPDDPEAKLVAREEDCTPRALLRPIKSRRRSRVLACKLVRGDVQAGQEVVLPGSALLKTATTTLKAVEPETPEPSPAPKPATNATVGKTGKRS